MKKLLKFMLALSLCAAMTACSSKSGSDTIKGTYSANITGEDWGCGVDKVIISLDYVLDSVTKDDFKVTETKEATDWTDPNFSVGEQTFDREVTDAYLCDENGEKTEEASKYVALELYISPNDGSPLLYTVSTGYNTWANPYYLTITTAEGAKLTSDGTEVTSLTIETELTAKTTDADVFKTDSYKTDAGVEYKYASYTPEESSETLFVWLHGMGEGGSSTTDATDPNITLLANKVTALAGEEFQKAVGGANILVPQCPTYWMDNDGKSGNFNNGAIAGTRDSYYTESLTQLIDHYAEEIGAKKIVIGGCSNGGYMTMLMAINNGDKYQAYVPICEALPDSEITNDDINVLKDLPMYFIYSKADTTVVPSKHEVPTIQRLQKAGASNLKVSTSEQVIDTSGNYKNEDGSEYVYNGHWSWIYFDNNEANADDGSTTAWDWIAEQVK